MSARGPKISLRDLKRLHALKLNDDEIAAELGCHRSWVAACRIKLGLAVNMDRRKYRSPKIDREKVRELHAQGKTDREIAAYFQCSDQTIGNIRLKLGLRNRVYKVRHLLQDENRATIDYLEAIKPFRGLDVTNPAVHEAIEAHNRSIELAERGWHERS